MPPLEGLIYRRVIFLDKGFCHCLSDTRFLVRQLAIPLRDRKHEPKFGLRLGWPTKYWKLTPSNGYLVD